MAHDPEYIWQRLIRAEMLFGMLAGVLVKKGLLTGEEAAVWRSLPETYCDELSQDHETKTS